MDFLHPFTSFKNYQKVDLISFIYAATSPLNYMKGDNKYITNVCIVQFVSNN